MAGRSSEEKNRLTEDCFRHLVESVFLGNVKIGTLLNDDALGGDRFDKPTRQRAIKKGLIDGLVELVNDKPFLITTNWKRQDTVLAARLVIEGKIVSFLSSRENSKMEIDEIVSQMKTLVSCEEEDFSKQKKLNFALLDRDFHLALADAAEDPVAKQIITNGYYSTLLSLPDPLPLYEHAQIILDEHDSIIEAINNRDIKKSIDSLFLHLVTAFSRWYKQVPDFLTNGLQTIFGRMAKSTLFD